MRNDRPASVLVLVLVLVIGGGLLGLQCTPSGPEPLVATCGAARVKGAEVFLNELAYEPGANGAGKELVELVGPAGTNLSGWSLELRTARGDPIRRRWSLAGSLQDEREGYGTAAFELSEAPLLEGSEAGIVLLDAEREPVESLSYDALRHEARAPQSPVSMPGPSTTLSLARVGLGLDSLDFGWQGPAPSSFGHINPGQWFARSGSDQADAATWDGAPSQAGSGNLPGEPARVFINEFHYDNVGADADEAVEIAGPAGTDLEGYQIVLYGGNDAQPYEVVQLSGSIPDLGAGSGVSIAEWNGSLQNGSPDGLALVDAKGRLLQLLSYEGGFTAVGGPADGVASEDVGVQESEETATGLSLQLVGRGGSYADFTWATPAPHSFGKVNWGQELLFDADTAPVVSYSSPSNGDFEVALDAAIELVFSEAVSVAPDAISLRCSAGGIEFAVRGGPAAFSLALLRHLIPGEDCTLVLRADAVEDLDESDPPLGLARDYELTFHVPLAASIAEVQGARHRSLYVDRYAQIGGIVTVTRDDGFYLQSEVSDSDTSTSEAVFVSTPTSPGESESQQVQAGDHVVIVGRVAETRPGCGGCGPDEAAFDYLTQTEIAAPNVVHVVSSGHRLPEPIVIGEAGRRPPESRIDADTPGNIEELGAFGFDACADAIDFYESMEHMLVQVDEARAVGPTTDFGQIAVVGDDGRHATHLTPRGGIVVSAGDLNPERILIDDAIVHDEPRVDVGARFLEPIVGVLGYSLGNFEVFNSEPLTVEEDSGLLREHLALGEPAPQDMDVATFNVENLSATDPPERFDDLADIVVRRLASPDVLVLEEIQDDSGAADDGVVDADETLARLAGSIEAAGGPRYRFADIPPEDGADGGQPGGNIRTAFMVTSERGAELVLRAGATARTANSVVVENAQVHLLFSPGRVDPVHAAFTKGRKPLVAEFAFRGRTLFVMANHWSSKLADEPLYGRWQPPALVSESKRQAEARVVAEFIRALLSADPAVLVVAVGDFNDFHFSTPLATLERAGLVNALWSLPAGDRYSYVFEGNSQALDHVLVSAGIAQRGFGYDVVHVNAEFHDGVSDHDPSVIRLHLD